MSIENPLHLFFRTTPLSAEEKALEMSASGNSTVTSQPAMDMVSVQRPDKPSPCPRCQSLDTKFCYFNNYNTKQPRHFCRKCQRYWTAGGSLRNVPVGAGRRKHKTHSNSTAPKLHLEDNDSHIDSAARVTSGMCYPSTDPLDFIPPSHVGRTWPNSFQHAAAAMSMRAHDSHSELNVCKGLRHAARQNPSTESGYLPSYLCHDAQSDIQQTDDTLCSLRHRDVPSRLLQKGAQHVQHSDEGLTVEAVSISHYEKVGEHVPPPSSSPLSSLRSTTEKMEVEASMSTSKALDEKIEGTPPSTWMEQVAKAMEGNTSTQKSMALHGAYGYGNASMAWSPPWMWPWLWPYANNNAQCSGNMDQAAASAAWASAVKAMAASFLQMSSMWSSPGWGTTAPLNADSSEGLSALGKRPRSPSHEQEPLCVPKTLKIGHPEEVVHSSILNTLGLSSLPMMSSPTSLTGFFNSDFQPKADFCQHKPTEQVPQHRQPPQERPHTNPAAQARSMAFQESS